MSESKTRDPQKTSKGHKMRIILRLCASVIALIPIICYLIFLPMLPELLPVKADSAGLLTVEVPKVSIDMIVFTLQGLIGVIVMYAVKFLTDGFMKRTFRNKNQIYKTKNTMASLTLAISLLLSLSWFLTIVPLLGR